MFHVGQEVMYRRNERADWETRTVVRVGRKWVYAVQHGREVAFHKEGGYAKDDWGVRSRIATPELLAQEERERRVWSALKSAGWEFGWGRPRPAVDVAEAVARAAGIDFEEDE